MADAASRADDPDDLFGRWLAHREQQTGDTPDPAAPRPAPAQATRSTPPIGPVARKLAARTGTAPAAAVAAPAPVATPAPVAAPATPPVPARAGVPGDALPPANFGTRRVGHTTAPGALNELDRQPPPGWEPVLLRSVQKKDEKQHRRATKKAPATEDRPGRLQRLKARIVDVDPVAPAVEEEAPTPAPTPAPAPAHSIAQSVVAAVTPVQTPLKTPPKAPAAEPAAPRLKRAERKAEAKKAQAEKARATEPVTAPEPAEPAPVEDETVRLPPVPAPAKKPAPSKRAAAAAAIIETPTARKTAEKAAEKPAAPPAAAPVVPPEPTPPARPQEMPGTYEFRTRSGSRTLLTLAFMAGIAATAFFGNQAYEVRETVTIGVAAIAAFATAVIWAIRAGTSVDKLTIRHGQLEVVRQGSRYVFDLASPYTVIEVHGKPGRRGWKVLFPRRGMSPFAVDSSMVDPKDFMRVLLFFKPDVPRFKK